jgi:NAD(P)-dependent dehydrogenase (short-subunit alcohol dehydrogenase family)
MDITDKLAIVTGAASGIGFAIAQTLASKGAKIVLCDIDEAALFDANAALQKSGATTASHRLDVSRRSDWETLCDAVLRDFGGAQILCNNAGISSQRAPIGELSPDTWDALIGVNLTGVFNGAHFFLSRLRPKGQAAHIVNTASVCGLFSTPTLGAYTSSKFGVLGLSEVMRAELAPQNVGVSALCPGFVDTGIAGRSASTATTPDTERAAMVARLAQSMPPAKVGWAVADGIERNLPYIFTHPEYAEVSNARAAAIAEAMTQAAPNEYPDDIRGLGQSWLT